MVLLLLFFALVFIANQFSSKQSDIIDDVDWRDEYFRRQNHPVQGPPAYLPPYYSHPFFDPQRLYEMENHRQGQLIRFFFLVIAVIVAAYCLGKYW